ncbi:hypothetical protein V6N13_084848 [Hibiscus sabdariffa]|uniref:S-protein homolog n=1 Tax=Hibiscus sabdariffa TaxID=183260 RepID=A0ABR2D2E9_9ROSI
MSSWSINWLVLLLFLSLYFVVSVSGAYHTMTHVKITNKIQAGKDLIVHCKSKDDDLGVRVVPYGSNFEFKFHPSFFGVTLFFCGMQWDGSGAVFRFDIYDQKRDNPRCGKHCEWDIYPDGPCILNHDTFKIDKCYVWN